MAGLSNREIADVFREIELLLRVLGEDEGRAQAYGRLAWQIERMEESAADLAALGRLAEKRGIGPKTQAAVAELVDRGTCARLEELHARVPRGLPELLHVPGLGPKRLHTVLQELKVDSLEELKAAAHDGRLAKLKGFGDRSAEKVRDGIAFVERSRGRLRMDDALRLALETIARLGLTDAQVAGPLRRGEPLIDLITIVAAGSPDAISLPRAERQGDAWVLPRGLLPEIRVRLVPREALVRTLFEETGPRDHVERVLARAGTEGSEEEIYASRGLFPVPPERRHVCDGETPVEILPLDAIQGLVHAHTTWSDGRLSLSQLAEAARARGYRYLALSDHSRSAQYANGLTIERLEAQGAEVEAWNRANPKFPVLRGTEVDILPDGTLDYPDDVLQGLDFVIASVHSSFGQDEDAMTERILKAVRHPHVDILGHPTGRLLLRRDPYAVDMERVLLAAAESGTAVELNANPWRLDLDPALHACARELGIKVPICPDAHGEKDLDLVRWGVLAARHGGLGAEDVPNTRDAKGFLEAVAK
ncbi:MAG TPA: helix-hairpin-helix domain-containing protein [Planctomycetota bacterium]|nr:helix-hairpin-helix domain-containing protein [Planctomycetota bacterium]